MFQNKKEQLFGTNQENPPRPTFVLSEKASPILHNRNQETKNLYELSPNGGLLPFDRFGN